MINWSLIREPYNWATVIIMAIFAFVLIVVVSPEASEAS
jgi:hypothetical protein